MYFQQISASGPDLVLSRVLNGEASTALSLGAPCTYDYTTAADGNTVIIPTTAMLMFPAGVVYGSAIAAGSSGLVVVKGHTTVLTDGTTDTTLGGTLICVNAAQNVAIGTAVTNGPGNYKPWCMAGEVYTTAAVALKKCFVNA